MPFAWRVKQSLTATKGHFNANSKIICLNIILLQQQVIVFDDNMATSLLWAEMKRNQRGTRTKRNEKRRRKRGRNLENTPDSVHFHTWLPLQLLNTACHLSFVLSVESVCITTKLCYPFRCSHTCCSCTSIATVCLCSDSHWHSYERRANQLVCWPRLKEKQRANERRRETVAGRQTKNRGGTLQRQPINSFVQHQWTNEWMSFSACCTQISFATLLWFTPANFTCELTLAQLCSTALTFSTFTISMLLSSERFIKVKLIPERQAICLCPRE